jgi:hypothetical protein
VLPAQQPLGHEAALHAQAAALLLHAWPVPHDPHAAPLVPHCIDVCDAYSTQVLPSQQPAGHDAASHKH